MKKKITAITLLLIATFNTMYAQANLQDFQSTSQSQANSLFATVKIWVYVISATAIIVSSLGLLITLKKNSVLKEQGDATKPIINFVVFIVAALIASAVTAMIASKYGYN